MVVALLVGVDATSGGVASVNGTLDSIIAAKRRVNALASGIVASVVGARIVIIAGYPGMVAPKNGVARIDCASNFIIARNRSIYANSSRTGVCGANASVVAIHGSVLATFDLVTCVDGARIFIITAYWGEAANSSSIGARVNGTS